MNVQIDSQIDFEGSTVGSGHIVVMTGIDTGACGGGIGGGGGGGG